MHAKVLMSSAMLIAAVQGAPIQRKDVTSDLPQLLQEVQQIASDAVALASKVADIVPSITATAAGSVQPTGFPFTSPLAPSANGPSSFPIPGEPLAAPLSFPTEAVGNEPSSLGSPLSDPSTAPNSPGVPGNGLGFGTSDSDPFFDNPEDTPSDQNSSTTFNLTGDQIPGNPIDVVGPSSSRFPPSGSGDVNLDDPITPPFNDFPPSPTSSFGTPTTNFQGFTGASSDTQTSDFPFVNGGSQAQAQPGDEIFGPFGGFGQQSLSSVKQPSVTAAPNPIAQPALTTVATFTLDNQDSLSAFLGALAALPSAVGGTVPGSRPTGFSTVPASVIFTATPSSSTASSSASSGSSSSAASSTSSDSATSTATASSSSSSSTSSTASTSSSSSATSTSSSSEASPTATPDSQAIIANPALTSVPATAVETSSSEAPSTSVYPQPPSKREVKPVIANVLHGSAPIAPFRS
ncbi:hypothetical protein K474DRAFT_169886 [Panus rudis PR-1116 ss-1]|nr:hypothetical protein K474DRAFT_169886 [Panus rudis PR-1116 ss-1]